MLHYDTSLRVSNVYNSAVVDNDEAQGKSLFCFSSDNRFRVICYKLSKSRIFEGFITVMIILSSGTLMFYSPLVDPESQIIRTIDILDIVFTMIFLAEAAIKIIAYGFLSNGPNSYLRSYWNVLEIFILLTSLTNVAFYAADRL